MMAIADDPNLAILEMAVQALGELTDSLVLVAGCATGLLVTKHAPTRFAPPRTWTSSPNFSMPFRAIFQATPRASPACPS